MSWKQEWLSDCAPKLGSWKTVFDDSNGQERVVGTPSHTILQLWRRLGRDGVRRPPTAGARS